MKVVPHRINGGVQLKLASGKLVQRQAKHPKKPAHTALVVPAAVPGKPPHHSALASSSPAAFLCHQDATAQAPDQASALTTPHIALNPGGAVVDVLDVDELAVPGT